MGTQEKKHRQRLKRNQLQHIVLGTIGTVGLVSVALVAPQALTALQTLGLIPSRRQQTVINTSIARMLKRGLLVQQGGYLRLTSKGKQELSKLNLQLHRSSPKRWDGKWRVLIFDIPEKRKGLRQKVRTMLRAIGFVRLQQSVWAYPYDCEDFIVLMKAELRVGKDMLYMIVDSLEKDQSLRKHFKLT